MASNIVLANLPQEALRSYGHGHLPILTKLKTSSKTRMEPTLFKCHHCPVDMEMVSFPKDCVHLSNLRCNMVILYSKMIMLQKHTVVIYSIQFNFICIALNHHYSLKGLNRPNTYDTTLTQASTRARKNSLPYKVPKGLFKAPWNTSASRYKL